MNTPRRDILVLLRAEFKSQQAIELEVEQLNALFSITETIQQFTNAHELVIRNHITSKPHRVAEAGRQEDLKAFWFLINKN